MKKAGWKRKIKAACQRAGTYRDAFDMAIDTLAGILEERDKAQELFEKTGGNVVISHTNKYGAKNLEKHPALVIIDNLNSTALAYWRDLGLTPAGLRRINDEALKEKKSSFAEALSNLGL